MNKKVVASCSISNLYSLNIYGIEYGIDDYVVAGMSGDKPRKYKLYPMELGTYFNYKGHRYYLGEFIRL
ncbi:hypothetical protein vBCtySFA70_00085 [Clostridium phage vB_CtyS-FA70]|nr:hypothetical protein vBCtySFA70_00085 [Clostridium phage vB_CtyS-FA70]